MVQLGLEREILLSQTIWTCVWVSAPKRVRSRWKPLRPPGYQMAPIKAGVGIGTRLRGDVYGAKISGHWQSRLPVDEARVLIEAIDSPMMTHPTF